MTLGGFIRQTREKLDISLRQFAKVLGITPPHLSDVERGNRYPSEELLEKIATELGVEIAVLREHDSRPPVGGLRRLVEGDERYAAAFRELLKQRVPADELEAFLKDRVAPKAKGGPKR